MISAKAFPRLSRPKSLPMLPAPKACAGEVQKIRNNERNKRRVEDEVMAETAMLGEIAGVRSKTDVTEEKNESRLLEA